MRTLSVVVPYRNWPLDVCEVGFKSLSMQTQPVHEIILVDIASTQVGIEALCDNYGIKYYYLDIDAPDEAIDVYLWNTCFNYGIRKATKDLVMYSAADRVFESNMVECLLDYYNWHLLKKDKVGFFCSKVYNLMRTPELCELDDFDALIEEATWRGGYGYWGSTREWLHKVRGLDETIRWYEDLDLARRASRDNGRDSILWISNGWIEKCLNKCSRVLHLANHPVGRKKHSGPGIVPIAQRGKQGLSQNLTVIRNGDSWGLVTKEKIARALRLLSLSREEIKELQDKGEDPLDYPGL